MTPILLQILDICFEQSHLDPHPVVPDNELQINAVRFLSGFIHIYLIKSGSRKPVCLQLWHFALLAVILPVVKITFMAGHGANCHMNR